MSIPLSLSSAGAQTTPLATLRATLLSTASSLAPGLTALPSGLIDDMSGTATGALAQIDQARVDAVNSITPYGANAFVLAQLGAMLGISQGAATNTSVYVVISGPAGYVVPAGFVVSDGTYQYVLRDGGVIQTSGSTGQLFAVADQAGTWAVGANTVTTIVTSVPSGYTLTVTNPQAGTPGTDGETVSSYRSRVLQAQTVAGQGTAAYLRTLLEAIPGVTPRLVSILQVSGGWEVICGGGDAYAVAGAIYKGTLDLSTIVGSASTGRNVTVTITDVPNSYNITFVNPPQQTVLITATWNTTLSNFSASSQVQQLAAPALVDYINSIRVGQPINELEMTAVFQDAVSSVISSVDLTSLVFSVTVNGTVTSPNAGTAIIPGDAESYFYCAADGVTVAQG